GGAPMIFDVDHSLWNSVRLRMIGSVPVVSSATTATRPRDRQAPVTLSSVRASVSQDGASGDPATLADDLRIVQDLTRWFPLWAAPGL
ncbi:hypothetical protein ACWEGV_11130, partial [Streptomyces sp. NPDC004976]